MREGGGVGGDASECAAEPAQVKRTGLRAFFTSLGILWTCLREAPDLMFRRKKAPSAVGS